VTKQPYVQAFDLQDIQLNAQLYPQTAWANLGMWHADTRSFVEANENLANHLARLAGLNKSTRLCDLGFGCGEQIYHWVRVYDCKAITAYNPSFIQYSYALDRLQDKRAVNGGQCFEKIRLIQTSAEAMAVEKESYDAIIALDAAYHFNKRVDVFERSYVNLRSNGGILAFTDMLLADRAKDHGLMPPHWFCWLLRLGGIPRSNLVDMKTVQEQLEGLGFKDVRSEDITDKVFPGMSNYLSSFIASRRSTWKWHRLLRYRLTKYLLDLCAQNGWLRYVSYRAIK